MGLILLELLSQRKRVLPFNSQVEAMQQIVDLCGYDASIIPEQIIERLGKHRPVNWKHLLPNTSDETIGLLK